MKIADAAREILGGEVAWEISIENVDKSPLEFDEVRARLGHFPAAHSVWLTRAAIFSEKSRVFPQATFVVGADTLQRIAEEKYYGGTVMQRNAALHHIVKCGCRFLVFGRTIGRRFVTLDDLQLPAALREICQGVAEERFRLDVSSTELRR